MSKVTAPEIGSTIVTQKSNATGVVQEVKQNATGSYKVKLLLADGSIRYTTVKQFDCGGMAKNVIPL